MEVFMIKQFKIDSIREENDNSKTVSYTVSKATSEKQVSAMSTAINIPANITDIDNYIFNTLVTLGWING